MRTIPHIAIILAISFGCMAESNAFGSGDLVLHTRSRPSAIDQQVASEITYNTLHWDPKKTAIILCDVWDTMVCRIPADRVGELAVRIDEVIKAAREKGVTIIHAPSGTMDFYADTEMRARCLEAPKIDTKVPLQWTCLNSER